MSSTILASLLLLGLVSPLFAAAIKEPPNVECHTNSDCPLDHCCLLTPGKYAKPFCGPLQEKGEICRPYYELLNTTLSYPDGSQLTISDVHYILCPCNYGLSCDRKEGACMENDQKNDFID